MNKIERITETDGSEWCRAEDVEQLEKDARILAGAISLVKMIAPIDDRVQQAATRILEGMDD
jgi:hypothetical protein